HTSSYGDWSSDVCSSDLTVNTLMAGCDAVFHLAAAVGVQLIIDEPVRTIRSIIHGTEVVLESAMRFGRPVLITSSSEVYGKGARSEERRVGKVGTWRWRQ